MDLTQIISRAAEGAVLSADERAALKSYRPDGDLRNELDQLRAAAAEQAAGLAELDSLRSQLQAAGEERDRAVGELRGIEFRRRVGEIAAGAQFTDPDYLAFRMEKEQIAADSPEKVDAFVNRLRGECPRLFRLDVAPGAGTPPPINGSGNPAARTAADDLARLLESAPEAIL